MRSTFCSAHLFGHEMLYSCAGIPASQIHCAALYTSCLHSAPVNPEEPKKSTKPNSNARLDGMRHRFWEHLPNLLPRQRPLRPAPQNGFGPCRCPTSNEFVCVHPSPGMGEERALGVCKWTPENMRHSSPPPTTARRSLHTHSYTQTLENTLVLSTGFSQKTMASCSGKRYTCVRPARTHECAGLVLNSVASATIF